MDFQQEIYTSQVPHQDKRSKGMALASMILGIIALVTCSCIYTAAACGSLSIVLALLSRGGEMTMDSRAKAGLITGSAGLVMTLIIYIGALLIMLYQYGGIDGIMQEYMNLYNVDTLEELYQSLGAI